MNPRMYRFVLILCSGGLAVSFDSGAVAAAVGSDGDILLQVHLPREVTVQDSQLSLGQISVVRGPGSVVAKVSKIGLGRFSVPGQKMVLDRSTILSRLASSGISAGQVHLTGAEAVTVRRRQEIIETEDFIEAAEAFLRRYPAGRSACKIIPMIRPKDLVLSKLPEDIELTPQLVRRGGRGLVTVQIHVTADGQDLGTRDIAFRLRYKQRQLVATTQIPEGAALSPENVKIETVESDRPEPAGWEPPYGLATTRTVPANAEIRPDMIGPARSAVVVHRNETVQIRLERPGMVVTAMGTALQEAHAGEPLKVRNADSSRVIMCRVNADGTVEPLL
jgi:flagellar basal body P-ring formation protein FlgA